MSKRQDVAKDFMQRSGLPQAFFAKKLGLKPQNFSYHLNESPELDRDLFDNLMRLVIKYSDMSIVEEIPAPYRPMLIQEETTTVYEKSENIREFILPLLADVPAGPGEFHEYNVFETITFDRNRHFLLRVDPHNGDSMAPVIRSGDFVICEESTKIKDGDLVAAKYDDIYGTIKLFVEIKNDSTKVLLRSMNPAQPAIILDRKAVKLWKVIHIVKKS